MTSINSNSACHPIVQTLATTDLNPQFVSDAARILSVLKPFNQSSYCQNGCKTIAKLFHEIAHKVHPDKCRNNEIATPAFIKAREARDTLCGAGGIEKFCDAGKPKNDGLLPDEVEAMNAFETWVEETDTFIINAYNKAMNKARSGDPIVMNMVETIRKSGDPIAMSTVETIREEANSTSR